MKNFIFVCLVVMMGNASIVSPGKYFFKLTVIDPDGNYPVEMKINTTDSNTYGYVSYPTYNCAGSLVLKKLTNNTVVFKERITKGADICANGEYKFNLIDYKIAKPKTYTLESNKYKFRINNSNFSVNSWLSNNCFKLNKQLDQKKNITKQIDYSTLNKCRDWSKKYSSKFNLAYEKLLSENIVTVSQAQDFLNRFSNKGLKEKANDKLELIYFKKATTLATLDTYINKYPSGKYINQVVDKKIELIYFATNNEKSKLQEFVKQYPNSKYTQKALSKLASIEAQEKEELRLAELERKRILAEQKAKELERERLAKLQKEQELARIKKLEDEYAAAYKIAVKQHTIQGYRDFIRQYSDATQVSNAREKIQQKYQEIFKEVEDEEDYKVYEKFINQYPNAPQKSEAISNMYKLAFEKVKDDDSVAGYKWFIKKYPSAPQKKQAILNMYSTAFEKVKDEENIAGYEWFIKTFPSAPQIKQAISNLHQLSFEKAKDIDTVDAYNTFVIAYPTAIEVKEANSLAYKLEKDIYSAGGLFKSDKDIDRKAQKLLIAAKKIERKRNEYSGNSRYGYVLIVNRMYKLLETEFDESEATLRHLESLEFKDFVKIFKSTMREINNSIRDIERNTSDLIRVSQQGFSDARADREMAAHQRDQKTEWDKLMHYMDKGYQ